MEYPILFSTPMVQALQAGIKTQTRRIIKPQPELCERTGFNWKGGAYGIGFSPRDTRQHFINCEFPYGKVGDTLWVRETFYAYGHWTMITTYGRSSITKEYHFNDLTPITNDRPYLYEDCPPEEICKNRFGLGYFKRPSIFMPKEACRIRLKITERNIEKLQDITEADAIAEGVEGLGFYPGYEVSNRGKYEGLWYLINGPGSWDLNPWVWVIEFKIK